MKIAIDPTKKIHSYHSLNKIMKSLSKKVIEFLTLLKPIHSGLTEAVLTNVIYACSKPSLIETKLPPSFLQ